MPKEALKKQAQLLSVEEIKDNILSHYNIYSCEVTPVKFKDTEKQRAVFKITTDHGDFCLKKVYYNEMDLLYVYSAIEWYSKKGIIVPKLLPTNSKGRYVIYKGMIFILTPWLTGEKCDFDNLEQIILSIQNLALMHNCGKNFIPINGSSIRKGFDNYYISIQKHFSDLIKCSNSAFNYKDKFSKVFLTHFDDNLMLAKQSLEILSSVNNNNLTVSLCHGDYVNKNILISEDNVVKVIDFDKCKYDYVAKDLSYFLRRLLKRNNTKWDLELAISCLNNYISVNPLTKDDIKYILAYLIFPQKYWKLSRDYYKNIKKCNKTSFMTLLLKVVNKTDYQVSFSNSIISAMNKYYNLEI
ncbi:CotS family spore coat protein [Clostridium paridis]|uniref:CotS family spore coat protein n=1 Tax=Clostridium paridis TaxID=2803863 RepID=A0A937K5V8_9CLOT|nr:CotS family spore coat protein [Clostridium paridis]MBL4933013.1 CotS family spore coat protein [Clostridium paridis]